MTLSRHIDPQTGEYTVANGAPIGDETVASEVVLAIRSKRGSAGGAPDFGSRIHTIKKLTPTAEQLAAVYAKEAIQHLIDRNEVRSPKFVVEANDGLQALLVTVSYRDNAHRDQTVPVTVPLT